MYCDPGKLTTTDSLSCFKARWIVLAYKPGELKVSLNKMAF